MAEAKPKKVITKNTELRPEDFETPYEYEVAREERRLAEKVTIQLLKDNDNYKDDVTVCINGRIWQIQRGIEVSVPRAVAEVLAQSMKQMAIADARAVQAANVNLGER